MLKLESLRQTNTGYTCVIQGRKGRIKLEDLVWIEDRQDLLEIVYWEAYSVLQGAYHCCLSVPGKVQLL